MKKFLVGMLWAIMVLSFTNIHAQRRGGQGEYNRFGAKIGATLFDIKTKNFITTPTYGFIGGLATRGDFYNNWDIQLGINISNNKLKVQGRVNPLANAEDVEYGLLNAQVQVLLGYKIIGNNLHSQSNFKLTAELGPVLMINSKMKLDSDSQKNYLIDNTALTAEQIQDLTGINANGLIGLSLGTERFRVFGHYQYGFNNILDKLNDEENATQNFKGNISMFQFGVLIYF